MVQKSRISVIREEILLLLLLLLSLLLLLLLLLKLKFKKSVTYSSQGSHTSQLDFCNCLADGSTKG